jgi:O-antigen biosynthesis protein WbqP
MAKDSYILKRPLDIAGAAIGLAVLWPVILAAVLAIRVTSAGPGVFSQERVGRNGARFRCRKLRTMFAGTESVPTHEVSASRVTPVGRFLRCTKLDELPQLWNVLKGEMSLVGPRPCLPSQTALVEARRREGVAALRPGITGLAQVRGIDMADPEALAAIDAEYLAAASLALDLRILLGTFLGAGMRGKSALGA